MSGYQRQSAIALDRYDLDDRGPSGAGIRGGAEDALARKSVAPFSAARLGIFSENGNQTEENQWR
jgi:hypothetical protein